MDALNLWGLQLEETLSEISEQIHLEPGGFFVVGCSTSEVAGKRIGTSGAMEIGETLYGHLKNFADKPHLRRRQLEISDLIDRVRIVTSPGEPRTTLCFPVRLQAKHTVRRIRRL